MFTSKRSKQARAGVTLTEFIFAAGLSGLAATALLVLAMSTGRSIAEMVNYVDMDHQNRLALDQLTREVRQVRLITAMTTNTVSFVDKNGAAVTYLYSPTDRTLTRTSAGESQTLLAQCDRLKFASYQRTPASNKYDLITTSAITNTKVLTVTWSCSRSLFGVKANTEQGQTAKIVIRNKKEQ
jgi:hypothetical protein